MGALLSGVAPMSDAEFNAALAALESEVVALDGTQGGEDTGPVVVAAAAAAAAVAAPDLTDDNMTSGTTGAKFPSLAPSGTPLVGQSASGAPLSRSQKRLARRRRAAAAALERAAEVESSTPSAGEAALVAAVEAAEAALRAGDGERHCRIMRYAHSGRLTCFDCLEGALPLPAWTQAGRCLNLRLRASQVAPRALARWALLVSKWVPLAPLLVACSLMRGAAPARRSLGFAYGVMWQWRLEVEERRGRRRLTVPCWLVCWASGPLRLLGAPGCILQTEI